MHLPIKFKGGKALGKRYAYEHVDRKRQFWRLASLGLTRWLLTAALVASIYAVLWHFSAQEAVPKSEKRVFNALISGFSIALGLNIASSLKAMMGQLRWWILSLRQWSPREADLILQGENLSSLVRLLWVSNSFYMHIYVCFWLSLNVASQIAIATLGLTYNVNTANEKVITRPGDVCVPDFSEIQTTRVLSSESHTTSALRYTANSYGNIALASGWGKMSDLPEPGILFNPDSFLSFCNSTACSYVFFEETTQDMSYYSMVTTNRSVSVTGSCKSWLVVSGGDGTKYEITIDDDPIEKTEIDMPAVYGTGQSMFMVEPDTDVGPSSAFIRVLEASKTNPWYYECNITIGSVVNAVLDVHRLGDGVTSLAAAAIALQGYGASQLGANSNSTGDTQFQSYPAESFYGEPKNGSSSGMLVLIAQFACGVIEVTAQANSNVKAYGQLPLRAIKFDISHWEHVHIILLLVLGLQLVFTVSSLFISNRVTVRDHSAWGMAALLRPAMQDVSSRASCANEKEIAQLMKPHTTVQYVQNRSDRYEIEVM